MLPNVDIDMSSTGELDMSLLPNLAPALHFRFPSSASQKLVLLTGLDL